MSERKPTSVRKGLPRRCSNERLKERRARSWARTHERKRLHREANDRRAAHNKRLRELGLLTPWEEYQLRQGLKYRERLASRPSAPLTHRGSVDGDVSDVERMPLRSVGHDGTRES